MYARNLTFYAAVTDCCNSSFLNFALSSRLWRRILCHPTQIPNTTNVSGIAAANKIHHCSDTCKPSFPKSKRLVETIVQTNVPGRNSIVTAAIVIIEAESRCVCSAIIAVSAAVRWFAK